MKGMKIFVFGASTRSGSYNRRLAENAAEIWKSAHPADEIDLARFKEFDMPLYGGDLEESAGLPAGARALVERVKAADAVLISTPEYNRSIPGTLKNAVDWVSRSDAKPFAKKPVLLISASPGPYGGFVGHWATRPPFETIGARVFPSTFSLAKAGDAFTPEDRLKDPKSVEILGKIVGEFRSFAAALAGKT